MNHLTQQVKPLIAALALMALILPSCNKSDAAGSGDAPGLIQVAITDAAFEAEETLGNRAATPEAPAIQRNTIALGDDFLMVAELRPEEPGSARENGAKAATDTAALAANIQYRVLVYDQAEAFVTERDYIRGQEASAQPLQLDGGSTYTFVVVSLNQTSALPATTPAVASRTLTNSRLSVTSGTTALMYYKQTMTVTGNAVNRLDIVLKHQKPLIGVTINSSQTGYNITAAAGNFQPHNDGMLVNLADGTHTQSGAVSSSTVTFGTVGSQNIVSTSTSYINAPSNNATIFTITSITIGSITATNLTPFTNLTVTPGVRYNLILNIVPADEYFTHSGRPAARINGVIWARHNVGTAISRDPDAEPMTNNRHGVYFQWGRLIQSADGTASNANPFFGNNAPANNSWNSGTEAAPIKTTLDPCHAGYRLPTIREMEALIADTEHSNMGPFIAGNSRYDSAKILTSKRNASVRLTLPVQGRFSVSGGGLPYTDLGITFRGSGGYYHTSFSSNNPLTSYLSFDVSSNVRIEHRGVNPALKVVSNTIRCVGIQ